MRYLGHTGAVWLGLLLLSLASGAAPDAIKVISPPENAVLPAAPFYLICKGSAELVVDGRRQPWGPFTEPVKAVCLNLEVGRHEIRVGKHQSTIVIKDPKSLKMGEFVRLHPIRAGVEGCRACHETDQRRDATVVGTVKPFAACLDCHSPAQFELKHAHPLEPLKHCASCHAPHGSIHKGFLKAPAKQLCAACHES
jgi:predicted CXXCH cytochrome family protein